MARPEITRSLAEWAAEAGWTRLGVDDQRALVNALIDTVGVGLIGAREMGAQLVRAHIVASGSTGEAEIWGSDVTASAPSAALANGVAAHIEDFDDVHSGIHGHPSAVLVPALVAVVQAEDFKGEAVLDGYLVGIGVMAAVSELFGHDHYSYGWHATSTCGTIGVAAGVAKALDLSVEETVQTVSLAVSLASGSRANFGTHTKSLHAGWAARAGVEAALLVRSGFTSSGTALEGRQGGVDLFGDKSWDWQAPQGKQLSRVIDIANRALETLGVKRYPCCGGSHFGIEAALAVRDAMPSDAVIESVTVSIPRGGRSALIHDRPRTGLEAKFSLPYTVAVSLAHGIPATRHFKDEFVADAAVQDIMARLRVEEDMSSEDTSGDMLLRYAQVSVLTRDGATYEERADDYQGSPTSPLSIDQVDAKFFECVGQVRDPEETGRLRDSIRNLDGLTSVQKLISGAVPE